MKAREDFVPPEEIMADVLTEAAATGVTAESIIDKLYAHYANTFKGERHD